MITAQNIVDRMASFLDAEGSDYYTWDKDYKYAINSAIEWAISVITPLIGNKRFVEEMLSDLLMTKVWQTSMFNRVNFDKAYMPNGDDIWTIMAIYCKPTVFINDLINSSLPYLNEIFSFVGNEYYNSPIVSKHYFTGLPLKAYQSTFRPELSHISSKQSASRKTVEEWSGIYGNPFMAGYENSYCKEKEELQDYAYLHCSDYTATIGGYTLTVPKEIELKPQIRKELVTVWYLPVPKLVTLETDLIRLPEMMLNILVNKALYYIGYKQGDGTTIVTISDRDLTQLLTSKI